MNPKLSILVCRIPSRYYMWSKLQDELLRQRAKHGADKIQILSDDKLSITVGSKRNYLLNKAKGDYVAFIDDDDAIASNYIDLLMEGIETGCDCASLKGVYSVDGKVDGIFEHSLKYNEWKTTANEIKYERFTNHLNMVRSSIAKRIKYTDKNFGEDFDWSTRLHESGLIKTEYYIPHVIYYYNYISNKMIQTKPYSQNSEQNFILDYFKDQQRGKFLDVGAYDTFRFSNVRALYEKGWKGVLVEPSPQNYNSIVDHYKEDKDITVLNVAIGETNGEIDFYESDGDAVSTSETDHMEKWGTAGVKYTKIKVQQVSVNDFMNEYAKDCDFISIDTEATNIIIFRNIADWVFEQIKLICIEHDTFQDEIIERLTPFGFSELYTNAENIILGKL